MSNSKAFNNFRFRLTSLTILFSFALSFAPLAAKAQQVEQPPPKTRQLVADDNPQVAQRRVALVIGNSKYESVGKLPNAANDAADMAASLRKLGFDVVDGVDQSKQQMKRMIREFGEKLNKGGVGLFFYAGHGVQYHGRNFLVPVDADIPVEDEIEDQAVDINLLLAKMDTAKNELNILILDACRNNPFSKSWSEFRDISEDNGLAKIAAPRGTVIFYSTEPGKVASDGAGKNGLFTEVLLEQMKKPDVELDTMIKSVKRSVMEKSKNKQFPYVEGTNYRDFYFNETTAARPAAATTAVKAADSAESGDAAAEPVITEKDAAAREKQAWDIVKNSTDARAFRSFLDEFPSGAYAAQARIKREQMLWDSIIETTDAAKIKSFLKEFPAGANAPAARIKLSILEPRDETTAASEEKTPTVAAPKVEKKTAAEQPPAAAAKATSAPAIAAKTKRKAGAKSESKNAVVSNSMGMEFVSVPAGGFMMGTSERGMAEVWNYARKEYADLEPDTFDNEKPQRKVMFAEGFLMGKTEVTQAQWTAIMQDNPSFNKSCDDCPVERVSWEKAKEFIAKLNERNDGFEYRLPTEAEWEYAARAGTSGLFSAPIDQIAWHYDNAENTTHPVAEKLPNPFGLYDMNGNVAEWCEDIFSENYDGLPTDGSANATVGNKKLRIVRGGYYGMHPTMMRSAMRGRSVPSAINSDIGLRLVARQK